MRPRRRSKVWVWSPVLAGLLVLMPIQLEAHTPVKGLGEFAGGFLHPLLTLPHMLVLGALGILLGQHRPLRPMAPTTTMAAFAAAGLLLAATGAGIRIYPPV